MTVIDLSAITDRTSTASAQAVTMHEAVERARAAFPAWRALSVYKRIKRVSRLGSAIELARDEIVAAMETCSKPRMEVLSEEIAISLQALRFVQNYAQDILVRNIHKDVLGTMAFPGRRVQVFRDPIGVVGNLTAYNGPFQFTFGDAIFDLVAGNTTVSKPSELIPGTVVTLMQRIVQEAGLDDVFFIVDGGVMEGRTMVEQCDGIRHTGSHNVGRTVEKRCESRGIPFEGEWGGIDAMLVFPDSMNERAVNAAVWGRFSYSGQHCNAVKQVLVVGDESEARTFAGQIATVAGKLVFGRDYGPVISDHQLNILVDQRDRSLECGAECMTLSTELCTDGSSQYMSPTVLFAGDEVAEDIPIAREEAFGPILLVRAVATEEEAIRFINENPFRLSASIWTYDDERARRLVRELDVGSVNIRDAVSNYAIMEVPFAGRGLSGSGARHGQEGLLAFTKPKTVVTASRYFLPKRENHWFPYGRKEGLIRFLIWLIRRMSRD